VDAEDRRIEAVNPRIRGAARLPETPGSLSGRKFSDLLPPDRADEPADWQSESNPPVTSRCTCGRWLRVSRADQRHLIDGGSGGSSYVITVQDLTTQASGGEASSAAQRLEAVGRWRAE
jgi:hypothetical protein